MNRYDDILHLPHHQSETRSRMPRADRAAQFSPFAALTGYDDAVKETARLTDRKIELDEDVAFALDEKIRALLEQIDQRPIVKLTYFLPDGKKAGGAYVTVCGQLKKVDNLERVILLWDGTRIPMNDIVEITADGD